MWLSWRLVGFQNWNFFEWQLLVRKLNFNIFSLVKFFREIMSSLNVVSGTRATHQDGVLKNIVASPGNSDAPSIVVTHEASLNEVATLGNEAAIAFDVLPLAARQAANDLLLCRVVDADCHLSSEVTSKALPDPHQGGSSQDLGRKAAFKHLQKRRAAKAEKDDFEEFKALFKGRDRFL